MAARLHHDHSTGGVATFLGLFVLVFWVWWAFTWYSAAFNDDAPLQRAALLAGMAGVAVLTAGIPAGHDESTDVFAAAYAALFALLTALYARAWLRVPDSRALSGRYALGYGTGTVLWLVSLALSEHARPAVWAVAMVALMGAPVWAAASQATLSYDAEHIAERYGLFTLIVLGEAIASVAGGLDTASSGAAVAVAVLGLVLAAAIWWLYFDRFRGMPEGGIRSGWVWAQGHLFVFAGIAAAAVGIEFCIEAAAGGAGLEAADRLPLGLGVAAYAAAMGAIRWATRAWDRVVALRLATAGVAALLALAGITGALAFTALVVGVFAAATVLDLRLAPPPAPERVALPHERPRVR